MTPCMPVRGSSLRVRGDLVFKYLGSTKPEITSHKIHVQDFFSCGLLIFTDLHMYICTNIRLHIDTYIVTHAHTSMTNRGNETEEF